MKNDIPTQRAPLFTEAYKRWLLVLLTLVYASSFMDRIIIATVAQAIKVDMKLSDFQLGLLGGLSFAFFYTMFTIPIARLAERRSRVTIISVCIAAWSFMTILCGGAQNYMQLLLCRIGVGIGEAGCTPSSHSLIADHFPKEKRASALAIYTMGVPIGATAGALLGGWIVSNWGWRPAFVVVGLPGLILAVLTYLTLREPPRGYSEATAPASEHVPSLMDVLRRLRSKPTFVRIALGCALGGLANFAINLFIPIYFVRVFGMSYAKAGLMFGLITGVACLIGSTLGGYVSDWAGKRDGRWYAWAPALAFLAAIPFYLFGFSQQDWTVAVPVLLVGGIFVYVWNGPTYAVTLNLVEPRMRASASAILLFIINLIGQGMGPLLIGFASDRFAARAFASGAYQQLCPGGAAAANAPAALAKACSTASATGLQHGMLACTLIFFGAAYFYYLGGRTLRKDLADDKVAGGAPADLAKTA